MPESDRNTWDRRYCEGSRQPRCPDSFFTQAYDEFIQPLFPHPAAALDIAGGRGRHALFLAEHGWQVTLTDISSVGIQDARSAAESRHLSIDCIVSDSCEFPFGNERFELVVVFFYLERELFPNIATTLRPGGLVVYKTFTREHPNFASRSSSHPTYFLHPNELLHAFPGFRILHYREPIGEPGVAELVARKP